MLCKNTEMAHNSILTSPIIDHYVPDFVALCQIPVEHGGRHFDRGMVSGEMFV